MLIFIDFVFYFVYKFYVIIKVIKYWLFILYYIDKIDCYVILNLLIEKVGMNLWKIEFNNKNFLEKINKNVLCNKNLYWKIYLICLFFFFWKK